ncbi:PREDICTED: uncharacterized protein LOC106809399 [Priapulus caudatus]|uniref:Uncharacterized protein LOC106809399 n=1 Tax=Priapulus caudatus TaxID=37621 RepID=A0ABM1E6Y1_PRICU|nr:PREDICTED: uncharacterized protein LOC106809399 [Priapulus caudatus]
MKNVLIELRKNPLIKITGDNLDMKVKTGSQAVDNPHKDHHFFVSNVIFSRIAKPDMSNKSPTPFDGKDIEPEGFIPHGEHKRRLEYAYEIILARIISTLPAFSWMKELLPKHIHHAYSAKMCQKSKVFQLPLQFRDEKKHDECLCILDEWQETLQSMYDEVYGSADLLHECKVVIGGDQLTRVRLQEAKQLRMLSPSPKKRLVDLHPVVTEMWHVKQDLLEKAYKELFRSASLRQPGTLYFFKSRLQKTDVNGKVKSRFQQHYDLLQTVFHHLVIEQALEYFRMENRESEPLTNQSDIKARNIHDIMSGFMKHYGYLNFSLPKTEMLQESKVDYRIVGKSESGNIVVIPEVTVPAFSPGAESELEEDNMFNYSMNLCHWALHLEELSDTAREGDIERVIPNAMCSLALFYSHSKLSKYFVENLDYILKCEHLLSPMQRIRVLEGSFVNKRGGKGKNVEADLVQEHSVRNQKTPIKNLGSNKTEKAILRATRGADTISDILNGLDKNLNLTEESCRHRCRISVKDEEIIKKTLRAVRPFNKTTGRECMGYKSIKQSPVDKINKDEFRESVKTVLSRLAYNASIPNEDDDSSDSNDDSSDDEMFENV